MNKVTQTVPLRLTEEVFRTLIDSAWVKESVRKARAFLEAGNKDGYDEFKHKLPTVMWVGYDPDCKSRKAKDLVPTQLFMIDIDHMKDDPRVVWRGEGATDYGIMVVHVTPSGKGLRIVARATQSFETVKEHMDWLVGKLGLDGFGDYDSQCKDLSRQSFLVAREDFLYIDKKVFGERDCLPIKSAYREDADKVVKGGAGDVALQEPEAPVNYEESEYRGHKLKEIAAKYVEVYGEPDEGERHNYYNEMVRYFRCICNNNYRQVLAVLPRFGHTEEECASQCKSICRSNTMSSIPKKFFFFLLDNGFYPKRVEDGATEQEAKALLDSEPVVEEIKPPKLPPVFREFCSICPQEFILPTINALMPIMGTLTSFLRADYIDSREQSTTFFSCIYAPPGSGKSFVTRFTEPLFKYLHGRDEVSNLREQLFLTKKSSKSANDKDPEDPHVSVRIMPAINSQPEFLQKMRDNKGFHMFTYAEEVDTFNKGSKAAGGDKSDLFRVAWDNAEYGQAYKSAATFKGMVRLYYNILLTGTPNQVQKYYKNVEDGMVTRVSFCEIKNQEFGKFQAWKSLNQKQRDVIETFIKRCDDSTYKEPLEVCFEDASDMPQKEFEESSIWRFTYRPFQKVNMDWLFPALKKWLEDERLMSSLQMDYARDTFRRRTAVKGFRLALICMALWKQITPREQKTIREFVLWWMDYDLQASLDLFGKRYNKLINENMGNMARARNQPSLYDNLPAVFEKSDVVAQALKLGIATSARHIVSRWIKEKLVVKIEKNKWKKKR
ncbi:MAG: DUF3987 domain-containing protein [Bacteroidales bacterium]|nr:DUF3987 domain-containing protein [Candidatus Physcousia equi]